MYYSKKVIETAISSMLLTISTQWRNNFDNNTF